MAIVDISTLSPSNCRACGRPLGSITSLYGSLYHSECEPFTDKTMRKFGMEVVTTSRDTLRRRLVPGDYVEWLAEPGVNDLLQRGRKYRVETVRNGDPLRFYVSQDGRTIEREWFWYDFQFRLVSPPKDLTWAEARFVGLILE